MTDASFYDKIELTEEELKEAILEGKKKKYFKEQHKDYWIDAEAKKKVKNHVKDL